MSWNYRVGTEMWRPSEKMDPKAFKEERLFSVVEVYYNDNHVPNAWGAASLTNWNTYDDLIGTHELMKEAFEKPIIDLDNFPNEYKEE